MLSGAFKYHSCRYEVWVLLCSHCSRSEHYQLMSLIAGYFDVYFQLSQISLKHFSIHLCTKFLQHKKPVNSTIHVLFCHVETVAASRNTFLACRLINIHNMYSISSLLHAAVSHPVVHVHYCLQYTGK